MSNVTKKDLILRYLKVSLGSSLLAISVMLFWPDASPKNIQGYYFVLFITLFGYSPLVTALSFILEWLFKKLTAKTHYKRLFELKALRDAELLPEATYQRELEKVQKRYLHNSEKS